MSISFLGIRTFSLSMCYNVSIIYLQHIMLLGFKTELQVNNKQRTLLSKHAGTARHAWNSGLSLCKAVLNHNLNNPEDKIKFPSSIDLHKWLVACIKSEHPWYYEVSKCAPQQALRNLRKAFDDFFKKKKGFPKFKKKNRGNSFYLEGSIKLESNRIRLPKIGWVKTYERLPTGITPKNVTVSRHADRWLVSFKIETEPILTPKFFDLVGVDLGVKSLATLSTGEVFEGAKSYKKIEAKLSIFQYLNRKKKIHSKNWEKYQFKIAKLHRRIANLRKDTLHKLTKSAQLLELASKRTLTTDLAKNHRQVVIEDLNVSGMLANHKLAKAVQDMGFYEFRRQLEYKCQLYGSQLIIADRWYPSYKTCSNCGTIKESLSLSERIFSCKNCHWVMDRDLNAAINLAALAGSLPVSACGVDDADISTMKQEQNRKPR